MKLTPSDPFQSLVFVTWRRADYLVLAMVCALGLGLTPCKPFLTRRVRARLASDLARLEALVRRLLVLKVLERPLPPVAPPKASHGPVSWPGRGHSGAAPSSCHSRFPS